MIWLLPPIIFEAGYNMNRRAFFENLVPTALFAFGGTVFSTAVVGSVTYAAGQAGLCHPLGGLAALYFGSLISATDPVTVLAVFQKLGVKCDLFAMVRRCCCRCRCRGFSNRAGPSRGLRSRLPLPSLPPPPLPLPPPPLARARPGLRRERAERRSRHRALAHAPLV